MATIDILKLNIAVNLFKIVSLWGASLLIVSKGTIMYIDFKNTYNTTINDVSQLKKEVKELKDWKQEVTAYYLPTKNK